MKKTLLALACVGWLALGVTACGGGGKEAATETTATTSETTETDETTTATDTDGDGIPDTDDTDDDGDGVADSDDAFPLDKNESKDTDGDGTGDVADTDDDGDGVADGDDAFPLDKNESKDTDGDGIGDNADTDDDGDGILDTDEGAAGGGGGDGGPTGDTTAPTVSVKTDAGTAVPTSGAIVTTATIFAATFSEAMNPDTVTTESVTLTCDTVAVGLSVTKVDAVGDDGIADNEWTITPADAAGLPAGAADCTLAFSAANTDVAGNGLTGATFTFETCGVSDDFSHADSLAVCWTAAAGNDGKLTTSNADGVETFTVAADLATAGSELGYTKSFTAANLTVNGVIASMSGLFATADETGAADSTAVKISGVGDDLTVFCGAMGNDAGDGITLVFFAGTPGPENPPATVDLGTGVDGAGTPLTLSLTKTGTEYDCAYTFGADTASIGATATLDVGASYTAGLSFGNVAGDNPLSVLFDSVEFIQ